MSRSRVRGPNSALTEFLRSQGINTSALGRARPPRSESTSQQTDQESIASITEAEETPLSEESPLIETTTVQLQNPPRSRGRSVKKKKKPIEDNNNDDDSEYNTNTGFGRAGFSYKSRENAGKLDFCVHCQCRFTITPYSKYSEKENGWLCYPCSRGVEEQKVPEVHTRKRRAMTRKKAAAATMDEELNVPKLQDLCIRIIAEYIHDIEALGDIGQINMNKISQIISKNRSLDDTTVQLFLTGDQTELKLYDCSKLTVEALLQIVQYCPHLHTLHLTYCGQMKDEVLELYSEKLTELKDFSIKGAFLVSTDTWISFLKKRGPQLTRLEITDTAKVRPPVINTIVDYCPNLTSLTLSRIFYMDDECVRLLSGCKNLKTLRIESPGDVVTDGSILDVLNQIGSGLQTLSLAGCCKLTDELLRQGIGPCCGRLRNLDLTALSELTDDEAASMFGNWNIQSGLENLSLRRCLGLGDRTVRAVLVNSGHSLSSLDLNGLSYVTHNSLQYLATFPLPKLQTLDVSWIRDMNDKLVCEFEENKPTLEKLLVWGNNHVLMPTKRLLLIGREVQ
ncbi:Rad7 Rhp7 [Schizosaccharomyces cryophilus OY26]|uniref:Rad7 Rhp7 n=1 Tax=Schizosaccharomyces cryophilus (strain OY26 / ATCC MYA-4695 / CBS 11777 / NBRC 106824 / NRRL Y48691) TaxID=653667 RepID=S9XCM4_SCHCR|nr:Rad7 Rhp7 [Schizosaccharomyces cryophilus OY26]EPY51606.1 Rad7 Rhp7 [Schizosaccharomyces cryophilus OY26]